MTKTLTVLGYVLTVALLEGFLGLAPPRKRSR